MTDSKRDGQKSHQIRVCYIAGREREYVRTRTMLYALGLAGFEVKACIPPDKRFRHYPRLLAEFLFRKKGCSVIIVGFYGALLLPFVRLLSRKPLIFDIHSANHETMLDWERVRESGFFSRLLFWVDRLTMKMADRIIIESRHHVKVWAREYGIPPAKFEPIFLASDDRVLFPREVRKDPGTFLVHFHGEFAPFHGVNVVMEAARRLKAEGVRFQIIGRGTTYARDRALAEKYGLSNCRFIDWVPYSELAGWMSAADVCLGFFGNRKRSYEVFTNKVVEALAVKKPLVTMRNEPVQELLTDGESVLMVEAGNDAELASAILRLKDDPALKKRIAEQGYRMYRLHCTLEVFSGRLKNLILDTLGESTDMIRRMA